MHRDTDAADAMLERLSDLLRLTLDRISVQQVRLKEELDFIDKYMVWLGDAEVAHAAVGRD